MANVVVYGIGIVVNYWANIACNVHPATSQVAAGWVYIAVSFIVDRMWVFKAGIVRADRC
jgi:putative flippase GtrA